MEVILTAFFRFSEDPSYAPPLSASLSQIHFNIGFSS